MTNFRRAAQRGVLVVAAALLVASCGSSGGSNTPVGGIWAGGVLSVLYEGDSEALVFGGENGEFRVLTSPGLEELFDIDEVPFIFDVSTQGIELFPIQMVMDTQPVDLTLFGAEACLFLDLGVDETCDEALEDAVPSDIGDIVDRVSRGDAKFFYSIDDEDDFEDFCDFQGAEDYEACDEILLGDAFSNPTPEFSYAFRFFPTAEFESLVATGTEGDGDDEARILFGLALENGIIDYLIPELTGDEIDSFFGLGDEAPAFLVGIEEIEQFFAEDGLLYDVQPPSGIASFQGLWLGVEALAGFEFDDAGNFFGGEDGPCEYEGSIEQIDPDHNMYSMEMFADCEGVDESSVGAQSLTGNYFTGVYNGLAFIVEDEGDIFFVFQVNNNQVMISDVLAYEGFDET